MVLVVTKQEKKKKIALVFVTTFFNHFRQGRLQKLNNVV